MSWEMMSDDVFEELLGAVKGRDMSSKLIEWPATSITLDNTVQIVFGWAAKPVSSYEELACLRNRTTISTGIRQTMVHSPSHKQ